VRQAPDVGVFHRRLAYHRRLEYQGTGVRSDVAAGPPRGERLEHIPDGNVVWIVTVHEYDGGRGRKTLTSG